MSSVIEIKVPDVGNVPEIDIVEVLIKPGDVVTVEQTLAVMETDKATMDLPSSAAGTIKTVHIKPGDKVSEGTLIATLEVGEAAAAAPAEPVPAATPAPVETAPAPAAEAPKVEPAQPAAAPAAPVSVSSEGFKAHATPSVRLFARELGVDLSKIQTGSGRKGRILQDDVKNFVKQVMASGGSSSGGAGIPSIPAVDFTQFGEIEEKPLSKIKRLTGQNLTRVWLNLPLVTYHDEVAIDAMEEFRKSVNASMAKDAVKVTGLIFIMKALVAAMQKYPSFNSSLSPDGEKLIFKRYFHIGIAVDTPNGLVVPVIRDVDKKGIFQLSNELAEKSELARTGKLKPADMQGGCMTISSLGGIGGTAFTPIVNAPEVAILGVTRSKVQPVWNGSAFEPKLMLPLDITYDHRVIDGAEGARFMEALKSYLGDIRRLLL
ncbi:MULTISPECIES: dihydrolipoyllysine-residue acetyltransferase [Methylomonas]|uniref:Acetyltransferase component of pyruvate dehydrogenase complex n=2 Tax=Methylomonas TaxID=416 RepID=A0A126T4J6_9GAMM|nr:MULTISPECIES: dihydrolipoyllysine-residue acetyltransferase [Methylomonas]AMK76654.1 branched-chain alpha-keto acid dehydrogenase subunit E2 [Methylomonas denitrificans]OAH97236.1 branched-chain alpha-keto acid dehydrogenase subunit E2 [Methylomonas methanica]TCV82855.1 pyruvate dehydrogenase E2 component (dihydrolipoamide acetyltransferase) [Methylomonas methanica]